MAQMTGHLSVFAVQSMRCIDNWMSTLQANLNGSTRNAFKASDIYYSGGATSVFVNPSMTRNGNMVAEQSLSTGHTVINWGQGSTVSSTQEQHFAINGEGFFAAVEPANYVSNNFYNGTGSAGTKGYLIRDGEFHWATVPSVAAASGISEPILVTKEGLIVLMDYKDGAAITGNSNNLMINIPKSWFEDPIEKARPSVVVPAKDASNNGAPVTLVSFDEIKYSRFGSTVYEAPTANSYKTIVNGSAGVIDSRSIGDPAGNTILQQGYLEASNTNVNKNITELATLGKIYQGFVQVIKVYNSNLDEVLTFVK